MNNWIHRNEVLKSEIVAFLKSQSIPDLKASCKFIAQTAYYCALAMKDYNHGLEDCEEYLLDDIISSYFDDDLRSHILDFINRKCALEYEALDFMDKQRWWEHTENAKCPESELQVFPHKVVLVALDAAIVNPPHGGSSKDYGIRAWEYPLSFLENLVDGKMPIIRHPGVTEICI